MFRWQVAAAAMSSRPGEVGNKLNRDGNPPYSVFSNVTSSLVDVAGFNEGVTDIPKSPLTSMAVIILIIVASLSLVVGAIYLLIYFKSIKPMSARSRSYVEQGGKTDDDGARSKSAHPFFRRK